MSVCDSIEPAPAIKQPHSLSPRIRWLRDYFFRGTERAWNNEWTCWSTGADWDVLYNELTFYIVPETYAFFDTFRASTRQAARDVPLPRGFWKWSVVERRAWFIKQVMVEHLPHEVLPGDLIAGARFNIIASLCLDRKEARDRDARVSAARKALTWFHLHGYGNAGATSGHLVPDHKRALTLGWKGITEDLQARLAALTPAQRKGEQGAQLKAMLTAASMPAALAGRYADECARQASHAQDAEHRVELQHMAANLRRVPWLPPHTFWEAVQALWINHMLVMADENYPGAGVSFGRLDQLLLPFWERSLKEGMPREFGKEVLRCFWVHANTAYDAMIQVGANQGITAGFGQLFNLSGLGPEGRDLTNDLTFALLEVIDEMSPILEPKPNVRIHRHSPEPLLDKMVDMIASSQGAPFLINFDERSMAGMKREASRAEVAGLIHDANVHDYASVGCLENTMVGNDRSGTVDVNLNLLKAVELALTGGTDIVAAVDPITGASHPIQQDGADTGDPTRFTTWEQFWEAYAIQTRHIIREAVDLYEMSEAVRADYGPTPYLSCLVGGCAESATDITRGGSELSFVTVEGVTFATTVDSLLAIKDMVFDRGRCTMAELLAALRDNWEGHEVLQAWARFRAPKYGQDDEVADAMAREVMDLWTDEVWGHTTRSTGRRFRPGMLSWNYWVGDADVLAASADGRPKGQFLSNAICPSNGADVLGPTANMNSVGAALGGRGPGGDWGDFHNSLPNGASHTITFNPSLLRDEEHRQRFKGYLRACCETGGTALQVNMVDADTLIAARDRPDEYRHLLVRVTGYNAYFTSIGRELQDEIIARELARKR